MLKLNSTINIGSSVVVEQMKTKQRFTYKIVSIGEADASSGKISTSSPFGEAVVGKKSGEVFLCKAPEVK